MDWITDRDPPDSGIYLVKQSNNNICLARGMIGIFKNFHWFDMMGAPYINVIAWQYAYIPQPSVCVRKKETSWIANINPTEDGIYLVKRHNHTDCLARFVKVDGFSRWFDLTTGYITEIKEWKYAYIPQSAETETKKVEEKFFWRLTAFINNCQITKDFDDYESIFVYLKDYKFDNKVCFTFNFSIVQIKL